jgi:hypothetical protein
VQVYYSASLQKQRIQDAMTQGLYEKTRDSQEVRSSSIQNMRLAHGPQYYKDSNCIRDRCRQR